jgi:probable O-glycosylation ligase (exosortase A-associated)
VRYALVVLITLALCVLSPMNPSIGLAGYYWFALMRPDILAWSGPNNLSFFIAVSTLVSSISRVIRNMSVLARSWICGMFLLYLVIISLSAVFAVQPSLCVESLQLFARIAIMALLIPLSITTRAELTMLVSVMALSIGFLGSKFGLGGLIAGGARFAQGYGGMLSDNNTLALALAVAVPLCWFARLLVPWKFVRAGMALSALLCAAGVVFTHSRGGALAVGVGFLVMAWRSKRRLLAGLVMVLFVGVAAYMVRDSYMDRMSTMLDPTDEASANSRILLAQAALKMSMDYPLFGVGFTEKNEQELITRYLPAELAEPYARKVIHNTYLQILVDSGVFALLLYVGMMVGTIVALERSVRRQKVVSPEAAAIPQAIQVALISYMVGAAFLSRTTFDFYYIFLMTAAAWLDIERREMLEAPLPAPVTAQPEELVVVSVAADALTPPPPPVPSGPRTARERRAMLNRWREKP